MKKQSESPVPAKDKKKLKLIGGVSRPKPKPRNEIPPAILNQINEFSHGGFYLISLSEDGRPVLMFRCDNAAYDAALKKFCINYFRSIAKAEKAMMDQSIIRSMIAATMQNSDDDDDITGVSA